MNIPRGSGYFAIVRRFGRDYLRGQSSTLLVAVGAMVVYSAANGAMAWLVSPLLNGLVARDPNVLIVYPLLACAILWGRAVSYFVQQSMIETVGERVVNEAQRDMFRSLVHRDLASINAVHSGKFVSNFLYDATLMRDAITQGIAGVGREFVSLIVLTIVMFYQDWMLALVSAVVLPGVAWAMERVGGSIRRNSARNMEATGTLSTVVSEALDGRRIIKAYGLEDHASRQADEKLSARLQLLIKLARIRASAVPITDIFVGIVVATILFVGGYQVFHHGLNLGEFGSFLTAMLLAQQPIRNLSQLWPVTASGVQASQRVFALIDTKPEIVDAPGAKVLNVAPEPIGGAVHFRKVSFSYHADASAPAVSGVDIDVAPGMKVALVGPSGSGKTTLFNLLLRFYDIDAGTVEIDGQDIRQVTLASLRRTIALVTQEPILFDESVADNIALGRPGATRPEIEAAACDAAAHDFIMQLPHGYDTRVGEGGLTLSGGQRQRIAIARAMLRNAPILLLDEATSALDTESERQVQEALTRLMKDRTTIVIAHRLSTVADADRLYVLDQGHIVESGSHAELMSLGGLYARLYQRDLSEPEHASSIEHV
ncbi:MAG: ABC transporter ATP-binding protein [Alphaproteobacteria bacterium]|nr:ABC transporter ATP-binding protein [Alphaproteobacteria bacterium]